jgi:hypothetical protein
VGIPVVCDGLWPWPHTDADQLFWVPQQVWALRPKGAGTWTVCHHHNGWSAQRLDQFERALAAYAPRMTDVAALAREYSGRGLTAADRLVARCDLLWNHKIMKRVSRLKRRLRAALGKG